MPQIPLGNSSKNRKTAWMPEIRTVNMLVEKSETNLYTGVDHIQRPGMVTFSNVGTGPIRGVFRQAGTLAGDFVSVSGGELYRTTDQGVSTKIGDTPGSLRTSIAATSARLVVASDGIAYSTSGAAPIEVVMPDNRFVSSVAQLNG